MWDRYLEWKKTPEGQKEFTGSLIGTPDQIREKLLEYEKTHVDQIVFISQAGNTRHEDVCRSLELFAHDVMPEFLDRHEAHEEWKRAVVDGTVGVEGVDVSRYNTEYEQSPEGRLARA